VSSEVYFCRQRDRDVASVHGDIVLRTPWGCRFAPFELLRIYDLAGAVEAKNNDNGENKRNTMSIKQKAGHTK